MIFLAGLALGIVFTLLGARATPRKARWRFVLLTPLAFGLVAGLLFFAKVLERRSLPEPLFTTPPEWVCLPAGLVALGLVLQLRGRRILSLVAIDLGIATACLALNYHASFGKDAIAIRSLLSPKEARYDYERVRSIRYVTHRVDARGRLVPDPRFVIAFDDGTLWTTQDGLRREVPRFDADAIELVGARSGRPRQQVLKLEASEPSGR